MGFRLNQIEKEKKNPMTIRTYLMKKSYSIFFCSKRIPAAASTFSSAGGDGLQAPSEATGHRTQDTGAI